MTVTNNLRLLGVFAHPDDETFGTGGTFALYARRGVETHIVCATRGEVGEAPADLHGHATVAEMREAELACAARIIGLTSVRYLGFRDSGMPGSPHNAHPDATTAATEEEIARRIAREIRDIRPQVVITFDPIGGYRHPDHIAVHKGTVAAFTMAGDPSVTIDGLPPYAPQKLYYHTFPRAWLRYGLRVMRLLGRDPRHFGANGDIDLESLAIEDFPIHADINISSVSKIKADASACHASQGGGRMGSGIVGWFARQVTAKEQFMRAIPVQGPKRVERDLFEGIRE
ncbi:MAG: PIG-L family deacetylase [Chloroflexi bacterium]|nr:PIG-L family deacetylase [Chloroflexota bacterium]